MNTPLLAESLIRILPPWNTGGLSGPILLEQAARQVHLAASRRDWATFDAAIKAVDADWVSGGTGQRREICLHFLPHLHLTGMDPAARTEALKRFPIALYREWREMQSILDHIQEGG